MQKLLTYPLRKEGYEVVPALDGPEALERLREASFDLVVLDVMLPKLDGFDVCRQIRSRSAVPIIMLTAKTEEIDKVLGLELGADDYITKPFSVREFRSRVKAVLRRAAITAAEERFEAPISRGEVGVDFEKRQVTVRDEAVQLTYVEFEILAALARTPRAGAEPHRAARARVGGCLLSGPAHHRRAHRHLREKLERDSAEPELILTVRGVGYCFRDS